MNYIVLTKCPLAECLLPILFLLTTAAAQAQSADPEAAPPPVASLTTTVDHPVPQKTALEIQLDRWPDAAERLVVSIGPLDVTDLFRRHGQSLVYRPELMPLPAGDGELVVMLQREGEQTLELLRQPIRVRTRSGLDDFEWQTSLDIDSSAQVDSGHSPEDDGGRPDFETATGQFRLETRSQRSGWTFTTELGLLGVTLRENALRFGDKGEEADKLDLASYRLSLEKDRMKLELGHTQFGDQRHLVSNFESRGLLAGLPLGSRAFLQLYGASGSQIVGFDNFTGLSRSEHQVLAGTLAYSVFKVKPEAMQIELSYLDGSLLPLADFNQGVVNDAEQSEGFAIRVKGSPHQRIRFDAGYASSEFDNPNDPLLNQGESVVPVEAEDRNSWFADVDIVLVQTAPEEGWADNLTLSLNHERIEPQYRSTAVFLQADLEQTRVTLNGTSGPIAYTAGHFRSEDNLDDIRSILKTKTRGTTANLAVPLRQVVTGAKHPALLPTWTLTSERTRQFGAFVPENGDFNESHVPDQVNLRHLTALEWQGNRWRFNYELSYSDQDNRQVGRETNDFLQLNHTVRFNLSPLTRLDLGFEFGRERAESVAEGSILRTERPAFNFLWRTTDRLQWSGSHSLTETDSATATGESRITTLEGSYRLVWREAREHGTSGQLFLRYTNEEITQNDTLFDFFIDRRDWNVQVGLNLNFH